MTWPEHDNALEKTFRFRNFQEAFAFMVRVAFLAEQHQHHPEWYNSYNQVTIRLNTHDAGRLVTEKDHLLAAAIDELIA